ncbi:MAG TPA: cytochrome P460 family protein [Candidatus Limnocylindria bacterium]|nr:cytochrome P460 family protein [Candidatus Limnocylindria bacterium]
MKGYSGLATTKPCIQRSLFAVYLATTSFCLAADVPAEKPADPAPKTDRVGFPTGYREKFQVLRTKIDKDNQKVVTVYGNTLAASVTNLAQVPYPYGSVLVMETSAAAVDSAGKPALDDKGALRPGAVQGMHVMRREKDFGQAYEAKRSGEWEYVEYKADGSYITRPEKSAACSACHIKAGEKKDFVYHGRFGD